LLPNTDVFAEPNPEPHQPTAPMQPENLVSAQHIRHSHPCRNSDSLTWFHARYQATWPKIRETNNVHGN